MVDTLGLVVVLCGHHYGKLSAEGDFDGLAPAFIGHFAKLTQMPGWQLRSSGNQTVIERIQQTGGEGEFAYF